MICPPIYDLEALVFVDDGIVELKTIFELIGEPELDVL